MRRLGLVVNPVAGMGGRVGLKGTDGSAVLARARELGAVPEAPGRAGEALARLARVKDRVAIVTYPHDMGEEEARQAGLDPTVTGSIERGRTTGDDTERAARDMLARGVDLLLFAGGDGTARNVCAAVGTRLPAIGAPAGGEDPLRRLCHQPPERGRPGRSLPGRKGARAPGSGGHGDRRGSLPGRAGIGQALRVSQGTLPERDGPV